MRSSSENKVMERSIDTRGGREEEEEMRMMRRMMRMKEVDVKT